MATVAWVPSALLLQSVDEKMKTHTTNPLVDCDVVRALFLATTWLAREPVTPRPQVCVAVEYDNVNVFGIVDFHDTYWVGTEKNGVHSYYFYRICLRTAWSDDNTEIDGYLHQFAFSNTPHTHVKSLFGSWHAEMASVKRISLHTPAPGTALALVCAKMRGC